MVGQSWPGTQGEANRWAYVSQSQRDLLLLVLYFISLLYSCLYAFWAWGESKNWWEKDKNVTQDGTGHACLCPLCLCLNLDKPYVSHLWLICPRSPAGVFKPASPSLPASLSFLNVSSVALVPCPCFWMRTCKILLPGWLDWFCLPFWVCLSVWTDY